MGSGAAGLTAAIYAARANLQPLVIEGSQPGGQLTITTDVENYPGFPKGIMGPELMEEFKKQAVRFGTEIDVRRGHFGGSQTAAVSTLAVGKETYTCDTLIVATGATAKLLGLESEKKLMGHGVSACATCDGFFFKDKELIVVGGGDTAMEEATFLTKFASQSQCRASHETNYARPKSCRIAPKKTQRSHLSGTPPWKRSTAIQKPAESKACDFRNLKTGKDEDFKIDGVFIAIGHEPNSKLFAGQLELDPNGYIMTHDGTKTNVAGVFACGDVQDHVYRQAVTAAGTGCMAAIDAERFLESQSH